jgi:hypothetical protein
LAIKKKVILMSSEVLTHYGLVPVATVRIIEGEFKIEISDSEMVTRDRCIYAFLVGNDIVRIGSSKAPLKVRLKAWERDVTNALQGRKSSTPAKEVAAWDAILKQHGSGTIFAREGTVVTTPVGKISTYLDEESFLIGKYEPRLNWSKHR